MMTLQTYITTSRKINLNYSILEGFSEIEDLLGVPVFDEYVKLK